MTAVLDRRAALILLGGAGLAACTATPPPPELPRLTYSHLGPFRFAADSVDIVDAYAPPQRAPNIEHRMPVAPAEAAKQWARDRLVAAGGARRVVFTVESAAVTETPLETTRGVRGAFTVDQSERYDAAILVRLEVRSADGRQEGLVTAEAFRNRTVAENLTLNERDKALFELTERLMSDLNVELERAIPQFLSSFLV